MGLTLTCSAVYGVDLEVIIRRENGGLIPEGVIPKIAESCLAEVERRGMTEVGICRSTIRLAAGPAYKKFRSHFWYRHRH